MTQQEDQNNELTLVIGSYTDSLPHVQAEGDGITVLRFCTKTGRMKHVSSFTKLRNPTYLALSSDKRILYSVEELFENDGSAVAALNFDAANGDISVINHVDAKGDWPCHVALDNNNERLFASNYLSGSFITYELDSSGVPTGTSVKVQRSGTGPNEARQEGPHMHCAVVTPDGNKVLVCDAGTDEIAVHDISNSLIKTDADFIVKAKGGSLPRHIAFAPDGSKFYVVHELGCSVRSYAYVDGKVDLLDEVTTLPDNFSGESACAAIRVHPNGKFVYASNRGHDSIVVLKVDEKTGKLDRRSWHATRGETPRDFAIDPTGKYLVAANQDGHSLAAYTIDDATGALVPLGDTLKLGSPVSVLFA